MKHVLTSCLPFRCKGSLEAGATFNLDAARANRMFEWSYFSVSDSEVVGDSFLETTFPFAEIDTSDLLLSDRNLIADCMDEPQIFLHFTDFGYGYVELRFDLEGELTQTVVGAFQKSTNQFHHVLSTDDQQAKAGDVALRSVFQRKIFEITSVLNKGSDPTDDTVIFSRNYSDAIFTVGSAENEASLLWRTIDPGLVLKHSMSEIDLAWSINYNLSYYCIENVRESSRYFHVQNRAMVAWAILDDLSRRAVELLRRPPHLAGGDAKTTISELSAYRRVANLSQLVLLPERAAFWGSIKSLYDDIWETWGFDDLCTAAQRGIQAASDELISAHAERRLIQDRRIGLVLFFLTVVSSIGIIFSWIDFNYSMNPPGGELRNAVATWSPVLAGVTALAYFHWSTRRR